MIATRFLFKLYRKIAVNFFRPSCRFTPTCSEYAEEAIVRFGFLCGVFLALRRLIRCSQFFPGGFDPVPQQIK